MLKALLFDLDGTLVETDSLHFAIWQDFLREYGIESDRNFYQAKISGRLNPDIVADLLPQLDAAASADFIWRKEAEFRNRATSLQPMPGLLQVLTWAKQQQIQLAVVTNAPRENAWFALKALKLEAFFEQVILGDDLPRGKPDPLPYQEALRQLQVSPEQAIAFEDSPSGIGSAVGANIFTVGIASTHDFATLKQVGAQLVVPDFTDTRLIQFLQQSAA
jgi:HAD superfamily hydrolase (TIGR01509 family)